MRIDLTCPVELRRCSLPGEQYPVCEMQIFNLTDKAVTSMLVGLLCYDEEGEQTARRVERLRTENAVGHAMFALNAMAEEAVNAAGLEVVFEKVWFEDGTVWRRGMNDGTEFMPTPMLQDERLSVMRELAGEDAITYPSDQGSVWVCVCGRPNAAREDLCRRCGRDKHDVFVKYNEAAVETIIFKRESAIEEEQRAERERLRREREEKEQEEQRRRRRRRRITAIVTTAVLVLAIAFGVLFFGYPYYRSNTANRWFENERYSDARDVYRELNDPESPYWKTVYHFDYPCVQGEEPYSYTQMILECDYREARAALESGTSSSLMAAKAAFEGEELRGYKDSAELACQAQYRFADKLMNQGEWEKAIDAYTQVPGYLDSEDRILEARYLWAVQEMNAGRYAEARERFLMIPDYKDAGENAKECLWRIAAAELDAGEYAAAIDKMDLLPDYPDAQQHKQILDAANYAYADQLYQQGEYALAAERFMRAEGYRNAVYRAEHDCIYAPAVRMMEEERWEEAAASFEALGDFEDSAQKFNECVYALAVQALQNGDTDATIACLDRIIGYGPGDALREECIFRKAEALAEAGDEEVALEQFLLIPDYSDGTASAKEHIETLMYRRGIRQMNERDWEGAVASFEQLGDYSDSRENLQSARYSLALTYLDADRTEEALEILRQMPDYERAQEYIGKAVYAQAEKLKDAGDYAQAAALFETVITTENAQEEYEECVYLQAKALGDQGELAEACALLDLIPAHEQGSALRLSLGYADAKLHEEAGDADIAAGMYDLLGDYKDAKTRAIACRDTYFAEAAQIAKEAMAKKDYPGVITALEELDLDAAGDQYSSLKKDYCEACYQYANQLYGAGDHYGAYAYYIRIPDYSDVSSKRLNRTCYHIIGTWVDKNKVQMIFRGDGSCNIDGKEGFYHVKDKYTLAVGDRADSLNTIYEISTSPTEKGKNMVLRRKADKKYFYLTRQADEAANAAP